MTNKSMSWQWEISAQRSWLGTGVQELFAYKDLLFRLVRKEFLLRYQQTLLGPFWVLIQPILTVIVYVVVFNRVIGLETGNAPPFLFYLTGITLWNLFSDVFTGTSATFTQNIEVYSKVYFPRVIIPLSVTMLHCLRFFIQFMLLLVLLLYFSFSGKIELDAVSMLLCIPAVLLIAGTALGGGLIFSVLTAKYRDLSNIINLITSLFMFLCPIFYTLAMVPENIQRFVHLNPLAPVFEMFRYACLGIGDFTLGQLLYSGGVMLFIMLTGLLLFHNKGDKLMDIV